MISNLWIIFFQFLYYTNCINLSICFLWVWRKKIRSSFENLNFNVRASGRKSKHTCFSKASAKVRLFFELTKYFCKKMQEKMHFLCKCLIISTLNFWLFLDIFGQIGHLGVFWAKRGFLRTRIKINKERACARDNTFRKARKSRAKLLQNAFFSCVCQKKAVLLHANMRSRSRTRI